MVFYRKYRPQKIGDLDSEQLRNNLYKVFASIEEQNQTLAVPHAFLFTGPKGLGKTSTARIVAKVINCTGRKISSKEKNKVTSIEPCNTCEQCIAITNGSDVDILEIDGASNRGIDEIRDLKEKIRLAPLRAKKKVYIIDEVHMLTTEAFNALLKTLEEPPAHVIFILCTTEPHKIPETIISRCFHIQFTLASDDELVNSFKRIMQGEDLKAEDDALFMLARLSEGSFRDGAKILEELVTNKKPLTREQVEEKYHIATITKNVEIFIMYLVDKDTAAAIQLVEDLKKQGFNSKFFLEQMIQMLHVYLLQKVGIPNTTSKLQIEISIIDCRKLIDEAVLAYGQLKNAVIPELPIELMAVAVNGRDTSSTKNMPKGEIVDLKIEKKISKIDLNSSLWLQLIDKIKQSNYSVAGVLRSCRLQSFDGKSLVIETSYVFHKDRLNQKTAIEVLKKASEELVGNPVSVSIVMKG